MILVLVLGGGFGWTVNRANRRRAAVDAVKNAKGAVTFDYQYAGGQAKPGGKPWVPAWLTGLLPVEFFHDVTVANRLDFSQSEQKTAKDALEAIGGFDRLEHLRMTNPPPGTTISGLNRLTFLTVSLARPGGERPIVLEALESLREVHLDGKGVNDSILSDFAGLPAVREDRHPKTRA